MNTIAIVSMTLYVFVAGNMFFTYKREDQELLKQSLKEQEIQTKLLQELIELKNRKETDIFDNQDVLNEIKAGMK